MITICKEPVLYKKGLAPITKPVKVLLQRARATGAVTVLGATQPVDLWWYEVDPAGAGVLRIEAAAGCTEFDELVWDTLAADVQSGRVSVDDVAAGLSGRPEEQVS